MSAKNGVFEAEGRWYDVLIGSCDFEEGVGLCVMVTDAATGRSVVDVCQVDSTKRCFVFVEPSKEPVPLPVMQRAMELFEERVRLK